MIVDALVGAQFGSEGKGLIAGHIAANYDASVRVGAANAGHTLYTERTPNEWSESGRHEKHVMQQIPCSAYAAPDTDLYIGPGALISPEIFGAEITRWHEWCYQNGHGRSPVYIDYRAHVITIEQMVRESKTDLETRIGSTSATAHEGIGVAQADRVMRAANCVTAASYFDDLAWFGRVVLMDVPRALAISAGSRHRRVLLEGTQGTGLSLTTGAFPYTTSRNTTVAGLLADTGIAPKHLANVILVARTYPIRVAGHSGPFYAGSEEINWSDIAVDPETERTTVTKKIRRVATFSLPQIVEAVRLNGATEIALTFCDYLSPRLHGITDYGELDSDADSELLDLIEAIENHTGVTVTMLGTGPHSVIDIPRS